MPATLIGPTGVPALEVLTLPLHPSEPVPPLAVQAVAFVVLQLSCVLPPVWKLVGLAERALMFAGGVPAPTSSAPDDGEPVPPGPEHCSVYVYVPGLLTGPMDMPLLEVGMAPDQPSAPLPPLAVQEVAWSLVQEMLVDCPTVRLLGDTTSEVTVAAGVGTVTVTVVDEGPDDPPGPVQDKV